MGMSTLDLFTVAGQTNNGGTSWDDPSQILSSIGAASAGAFTPGGFTDILWATGPISGGQVPGTSLITNIRVVIRAGVQFSGGSAEIRIKVAGGSEKTDGIGSNTTVDLSGDLTYWGLTDAEAHELAAGTRQLQSYTFHASNVEGINVIDYKVQFTWEGGLIAPTVLF